MLTITIINSISVFLAYLARNKSSVHFLKLSFVVIFYVLALRYDFGNDYSAYMDGFYIINSNPNISYFGGDIHFESGWIFLCRLFKPFGFFALIAFLSLFNCVVYYRFIRKYVQPSYYWFAVFFYTFNPSIMLVHQTAIRQSIAIAIFLISLKYICSKDVIRYFLCIAIAALFHTTALVLFPLYLIGFINFKINKWLAVIVFTTYLSLFWFTEVIMSSISLLLLLKVKIHALYLVQADSTAGLGVYLYSGLLLLILFYAKNDNGEKLILTKVSMLHFAIIPLGLFVSMFYRIGFYFTPALMAVFPQLFSNIRPLFFKRSIVILVVLHTMYSYNQFMNSETYSEAFSTYKTILSH